MVFRGDVGGGGEGQMRRIREFHYIFYGSKRNWQIFLLGNFENRF